uniref:Reverse transcriptase domain-containing protein n=1 Tax=Tanacetum cinerariifolium TaxID=118510 RepID=A0A6L2JJQ6_TANCI|nr:reverse transcriptase domain-containing protein [Tanacetum cinerariifolium]
MSLEESDDLNIPDATPVNPVLEAGAFPKFDMHLYKSSLNESHVRYLVKLYGISEELHLRVVPKGMTMNALPSGDIGLYVHHFQQRGLRDKFILVDRRAAPIAMAWRHHDSSVAGPLPRPSEYNASDVAKLREVVISLRRPPLSNLYVAGLSNVWKHAGRAFSIKDSEGKVITMAEFLRLPNCNGCKVSVGTLFSSGTARYEVTHRLSTAYHPQMSGQVEVTNHGLKRILERTVGENRALWSDKLEDALWAFRTAFKTLIVCTPYRLVYGKSCHLPLELKHKAFWTLKHANFDLKTVGDHKKLQLNELSKLRDQAYKNSLIYKERTKKLHDAKIKNQIFNLDDQVLLFNSRLKIFSRKLKSRWSGPFRIAKVYPNGTAKLVHADGSNFKVNCHHLKHYHGRDTPPV